MFMLVAYEIDLFSIRLFRIVRRDVTTQKCAISGTNPACDTCVPVNRVLTFIHGLEIREFAVVGSTMISKINLMKLRSEIKLF